MVWALGHAVRDSYSFLIFKAPETIERAADSGSESVRRGYSVSELIQSDTEPSFHVIKIIQYQKFPDTLALI